MMENYHTLGERQLQQLVIAAEDKGAATEITAVYHTVQHSQLHRSADCGSKLAPAFFFQKKKKKCGRTKAACFRINKRAVGISYKLRGGMKVFVLIIWWT